MILFCDTSALLKLYVAETDSGLVRSAVDDAKAVMACRIAWAEAFAALARRAREVPKDQDAIESAKAALSSDWPHYIVLEVTQSLVQRAGEYADTFALRGYDSVQLAAAAEAAEITGAEIGFACFDIRLNRAARVLGLRPVFDP